MWHHNWSSFKEKRLVLNFCHEERWCLRNCYETNLLQSFRISVFQSSLSLFSLLVLLFWFFFQQCLQTEICFSTNNCYLLTNWERKEEINLHWTTGTWLDVFTTNICNLTSGKKGWGSQRSGVHTTSPFGRQSHVLQALALCSRRCGSSVRTFRWKTSRPMKGNLPFLLTRSAKYNFHVNFWNIKNHFKASLVWLSRSTNLWRLLFWALKVTGRQ